MLEGAHPGAITDAERKLLLAWLAGPRVSEDYDNPDLGDSAPSELLARRCLECHARAAVKGTHADAKVSLEYWEDVKAVAFSTRIEPTPIKLLLASTHAHALALGSLSIVLGLLLCATRFSTRLTGALFGVAGVALLLDLAGWWLARESDAFVTLILAAGAAYAFATGLSIVLVVLDLWLPRRT
ncbi:MAG: hypothetical protein IPJ77_17375 [Planctomycetes bacterium]|nr:hypothetical protein [Planctomycetota bacterium]